jgi:hypothetical protein
MECEDCQYSGYCDPDKYCPVSENEYEDRLEQEQARMASCCCGAFQWVDKKGYVQVADCCCGRT